MLFRWLLGKTVAHPKLLSELKPGEKGYTVPTMLRRDAFNNKFMLSEGFIDPKPDEKATMLVVRNFLTGGYHVYISKEELSKIMTTRFSLYKRVEKVHVSN